MIGDSFRMTRLRALPRSAVLLIAVVIIVGLGLFIRQLPGDWTLTTANKAVLLLPEEVPSREEVKPVAAPLFDGRDWRLQTRTDDQGRLESPAESARQQQVRVLFEHGANLMRQRQFPQARKALEMLIELAPRLPEAYVNLGFVLYELSEIESSINAFNYASQLNLYQSNAYYGAALGYERLLDYEAAMGHMRSFIHLSQADNAFLPKARAALWEWEQVIDQRRQAVASSAVLSIEQGSKAITPSDVSEDIPSAQQ